MFFHISAGEGEEIKFLCSCVHESVFFIPVSEHCVFLHDPDVDFFTFVFFRLNVSVLQKLYSDFIVSVFGKHAEIVQLALVVVLQQKRIVAEHFSIVGEICVHGAALVLKLIQNPFFRRRKCREARCVLLSKSECVGHGLETCAYDFHTFRHIIFVDLPYHDFLPDKFVDKFSIWSFACFCKSLIFLAKIADWIYTCIDGGDPMPEIHSWNVEKIATERHIKSCEPQPFEWKKGTEYLIDFAAKNDVQKCAEFLNAGVDINSCNEFGMSALMVACDFGAMDVVRFLLTHGAVPDTQNENGLTALMIAAARNDTEMVAMLLKYGADYTMREKSGWNALMIACAEGAKDTVVQLIKTGMDLNVRNDENDSALTIAMKSGAHDCVYHLMKAGAKVDKPKKDGPKCLMFPKEDPFYDKADSYRTDLLDPRMVALKNSTTDSLRQTDVEAYIYEAASKINMLAKDDYEKVKMVHDLIFATVCYDQDEVDRRDEENSFIYKNEYELIRNSKYPFHRDDSQGLLFYKNKETGEYGEIRRFYYRKDLSADEKKFEAYVGFKSEEDREIYRRIFKSKHEQDYKTVLRLGTGVCLGIANVFKRFCDELHIECFRILGDISMKNRNMIYDPISLRGNHAWNMVVIDGRKLMVDCTFDMDGYSTSYLLVRPAIFFYSHYTGFYGAGLTEYTDAITFYSLPLLTPDFFDTFSYMSDVENMGHCDGDFSLVLKSKRDDSDWKFGMSSSVVSGNVPITKTETPEGIKYVFSFPGSDHFMLTILCRGRNPDDTKFRECAYIHIMVDKKDESSQSE